MLRIKARIERLEQSETFDATGPIPFAVIDRIIGETISDREYERWRTAFNVIVADADAWKAGVT